MYMMYSKACEPVQAAQLDSAVTFTWHTPLTATYCMLLQPRGLRAKIHNKIGQLTSNRKLALITTSGERGGGQT